ncbi:hypothetical protein WS58_17945 [Burkholderia pseudomultivorans]|nr:hypothetical protein WS58_17945 [Burkholderia pseudomultivorans]
MHGRMDDFVVRSAFHQILDKSRIRLDYYACHAKCAMQQKGGAGADGVIAANLKVAFARQIDPAALLQRTKQGGDNDVLCALPVMLS